MNVTTLLQRQSISVTDFRCSAGPDDTPFVERHRCHSISFVRKGSFGCRSRGRFFELVAGSILVGYPGDEYVCSHDHVCGDECLSFFLEPELVQAIGDRADIWQIGSTPPLPELMVFGELAQAAAEGRSDIGLDEIGQRGWINHPLAGDSCSLGRGRQTARRSNSEPFQMVHWFNLSLRFRWTRVK